MALCNWTAKGIWRAPFGGANWNSSFLNFGVVFQSVKFDQYCGSTGACR